MTDQTPERKPEFHLMSPPFTADRIAALFRNLTGKEPTPEELARLREKWDKGRDDGSVMNPDPIADGPLRPVFEGDDAEE